MTFIPLLKLIFDPLLGISLSKKRTPEIQILDEKEYEKLQHYVSDNRSHTTMGIALAMSTGIRIGELCALQWEDIELEKRTLTARKTIQRIQCSSGNKKTKLVITDPKSESSRRTISINENIVDFLKSFKSDSKKYVLSGTEKPIEPRTMQYRFAKILQNV